MTDAAIRSRADELIAGMTVEEKAGQLTQYFYFGSLTGRRRRASAVVPSEPATVEAALGRGEVGSLLFMTDPARDQPPPAAGDRGQPARRFPRCSAST